MDYKALYEKWFKIMYPLSEMTPWEDLTDEDQKEIKPLLSDLSTRFHVLPPTNTAASLGVRTSEKGQDAFIAILNS